MDRNKVDNIAQTSLFIGSMQRKDTLTETFNAVQSVYAERNLFSTFFNCEMGPWVTYRDFFKDAGSLGSGLGRKFNLKRGDVVAICSDNVIEWFLAEYGCLLHGYVCLGLPSSHPETAEDLCSRFSAKVLFMDPSLNVQVPSTITIPLTVAAPEFSDLLALGASHPRPPPADLSDDDLFTIFLTSGTTGPPKGVPYTRGTWNREMASYPSDHLRGVSYLPLSNIVDRHHTAVTMFNGGEMAIVRPVHAIFEALPTIHPTILFTTPVICSHLASLAPPMAVNDAAGREAVGRVVGNALRMVVCGAGRLDEGVIATLRSRFFVKVLNHYGMTDIGNIAVDGRLLPSVRVRLSPVPDLGYLGDGDEGSGAPWPRRGELLVAVQEGFGGYISRCDAEREAAAAGGRVGAVGAGEFFSTGDLVELGEDRSIRVLGRRSGGVKLPCGEWVVPTMLEEAILACPSLRDRFDNVFVECRQNSDRIAALLSPRSGTTVVAAALGEGGGGEMKDETVLPGVGDKRRRLEGEDLLQEVNRALEAKSQRDVSWVGVAQEAFSLANGQLNGTMKLDRAAIRRRYATTLDQALQEECGERRGLLECTVEFLSAPDGTVPPVGLGSSMGGSTFRQLGGDSILALRVRSRLKQMHVPFPDGFANLLLGHDTLEKVRENVAVVRNRRGESAATNGSPSGHFDGPSFRAAVTSALAERPSEAALEAAGDCDGEVVVVTGALGFIGRQVIAEVLRTRPRATVVCLVRSSRVAAARDLLSRAGAMLAGEEARGGVEVVAGDVALKMFGWEEADWVALAARTTAVVHCAGCTNQALEWDDLRVNLDGTIHALLLAAAAPHLRRFVLCGSTDTLRPGDPEELDTVADKKGNGYLRIKRAEEAAVAEAAAAGLRGLVVCRLCLICNALEFTSDAKQSLSAALGYYKEDHIDILLQGCRLMGCVPVLPPPPMPCPLVPAMLPVDVAANWLVALGLGGPEPPLGRAAVYHLVHPDGAMTGRGERLSYHEVFESMGLPAADDWVSRIPAASPLGCLWRTGGVGFLQRVLSASDKSKVFADGVAGCGVVMVKTKAALKCVGAWNAPSMRSLIEAVLRRILPSAA